MRNDIHNTVYVNDVSWCEENRKIPKDNRRETCTLSREIKKKKKMFTRIPFHPTKLDYTSY